MVLPLFNFSLKAILLNCAWFVLNCAFNFTICVSPFPKIYKKCPGRQSNDSLPTFEFWLENGPIQLCLICAVVLLIIGLYFTSLTKHYFVILMVSCIMVLSNILVENELGAGNSSWKWQLTACDDATAHYSASKLAWTCEWKTKNW